MLVEAPRLLRANRVNEWVSTTEWPLDHPFYCLTNPLCLRHLTAQRDPWGRVEREGEGEWWRLLGKESSKPLTEIHQRWKNKTNKESEWLIITHYNCFFSQTVPNQKKKEKKIGGKEKLEFFKLVDGTTGILGSKKRTQKAEKPWGIETNGKIRAKEQNPGEPLKRKKLKKQNKKTTQMSLL